jgi:tetratricopeptide (TPR) repeat protein
VSSNSINKPGFDKPAVSSGSNAVPGSNPALPPDHPPLGTSTGNQTQGAPLPQVTEAIEKARLEPRNYEAQMTAADLYYQIQRFDEAAKFYEAAIKLKPAEAEPLIKAGNAYFDAEKYEQAEKWYLLALVKEPKNINVRTDLGLTFFLRSPRDIDRAIKEYKTSLSIDPNHEVTLQNLAQAYKELGDTTNYNKTIETLRAVNPNNPILKQ